MVDVAGAAVAWPGLGSSRRAVHSRAKKLGQVGHYCPTMAPLQPVVFPLILNNVAFILVASVTHTSI